MKTLHLAIIVISAVCIVIFHSNSIIAYADTRYYDQIPVPPIQILSANGGPSDLAIKQGVPTDTATVSFDQKTYMVGDTATITVNDPNLDTDNNLIVTYSSVLPVDTLSNPQDPATDTVGQAGLGTYSDGTPIGMLFDIQWGQKDQRWSNSDVPTDKITTSCWGGANSSTGTPGRFATGLGASGFFLAETAAGSGVFQGTFEIPDRVCLAPAGTTGGAGVSTVVNGMNIKASYYFRNESGKLVEVSDTAGIRGKPSGLQLVSVSTDKYVYMPGDIVLIKGKSYLNDTDAKISLEKNDKIPVITKDIPINKNGTFYANFTIPFDTTARSWWLATTVGGGTLHQGIHFKSESIPPLDQFWSGISPNDTLCKSNLTLIFKTKDDSPACVKPDTAQKLTERGWARQGTYYRDIHVQPEITLNDYNYSGIDQDSDTTVSINNQTYYQTTLNYSAYKLPAATPIQFHNVTFTFPAGTFLTPGGAIIMVDIRFPDGYAETYGNHTANGGSGILVPTPYGPHTAVNSTTILSNHMRPQAGMTIYHDKIRLLVSTEGQSAFVSIPTVTSPPTLCDIPYNPKENVITPLLPNGTHTITEYTPILYMPMNSTGKICVQYSNGNQPAHVGIRVFEADNLGKDSDTVTTSASKDIIPTGNSTVVYTINSGSKAGFYGVSLFCGGQGLAIGYDNNSRIVLGDFPWYGQTFHCLMQTYTYKITGLSNIGIYYITKTTHEQIGYNITGVSVSSVHPTSTSQNVTFSFNVRTYNSGAHLWFDYKDSTLSKYFGDPGLKEESNPCTWDITNPNSLDNAQEFQFIGNAVVNDNPVTIPPYSNGTYTFSIIAKGLGPGIYRLNPVIYSESTDSKIPQDSVGGAAVAQNYPLTIGLDSNIDPSGICR